MLYQHTQLHNYVTTIAKLLKIITTILVCSLLFNILTTVNTHAAGTADIKTTFGATGDGIADDTAAIKAAFDSDYDTIILPDGEYRQTYHIEFSKVGNKEIIGARAIIFTDDTYTTTTHASNEEAPIRIRNINNVTIRGLRFEARQKQIDPVWSEFLQIRDATGIHLDSLDFWTPADSPELSPAAIDFWGNWHDVSITNTSSIDMSIAPAGMAGGGMGFRDLTGSGGSNAKFYNNILYKTSHDEILGIAEYSGTSGLIDQVDVAGNRLHVGDPTGGQNVFTLTFNGMPRPDLSSTIRNVDFHHNEILGQGNNALMLIRGAENLDIHDNDLYNKANPQGTTPVGGIVTSADATTTPNTNVTIRNNHTVTLDANGLNATGVTSGSNPVSFIDNPKVLVTSKTVASLLNNPGLIARNNIRITGDSYSSAGGGLIGDSAANVQNNTILVEGSAHVIFRHYGYGNALSRPISITDNNITIMEKRPGETMLAQMWHFSMDSHTISIRGNTVTNGSQFENDPSSSLPTNILPDLGSNTATYKEDPSSASHLGYFGVSDTAPTDQTVYFCNNTLSGFESGFSPSSTTRPTIVMNCP